MATQKKNKYGEELVQISALIKRETYDEIKDVNAKFNQLIELGLRAFKDNPQLLKRLAAVEQKVALLERVDSRIYGRIDQIKHEIERIES